MRPTHPSRFKFALTLTLLAVCSGCASGLAGVKQALSNAERIGAASARAFGDFDEQHQADIAHKAMAAHDLVAGGYELAIYRAERTKVMLAFSVFDAAVAATHASIAAAENGAAVDFTPLLLDLARAAIALKDAVMALQTAPPPPPPPPPDAGEVGYLNHEHEAIIINQDPKAGLNFVRNVGR